jgi:hypothetical protein
LPLYDFEIYFGMHPNVHNRRAANKNRSIGLMKVVE